MAERRGAELRDGGWDGTRDLIEVVGVGEELPE